MHLCTTQHKARNLLKRVGKMEVSRHDGEDFEKANLLLAKFYIDKVSVLLQLSLLRFFVPDMQIITMHLCCVISVSVVSC